ncbi:MAG: hypothetical protein KDD51_08320 [Bdellovibrionales bacterium]|nr:hypothetical protein [Bdellovibrionales bacterium]
MKTVLPLGVLLAFFCFRKGTAASYTVECEAWSENETDLPELVLQASVSRIPYLGSEFLCNAAVGDTSKRERFRLESPMHIELLKKGGTEYLRMGTKPVSLFGSCDLRPNGTDRPYGTIQVTETELLCAASLQCGPKGVLDDSRPGVQWVGVGFYLTYEEDESGGMAIVRPFNAVSAYFINPAGQFDGIVLETIHCRIATNNGLW